MKHRQRKTSAIAYMFNNIIMLYRIFKLRVSRSIHFFPSYEAFFTFAGKKLNYIRTPLKRICFTKKRKKNLLFDCQAKKYPVY